MEYFHKDRLGSTVALSTDTGDRDAYYLYDPYGQARKYYRYSDQAKANTLMYVGLPRDWATGLVRMGARWYDPTIGRFTTADPSGQETNPYLYAVGNPICMTDPTGLNAACNLAGMAIGATSSIPGIGQAGQVAIWAFGGAFSFSCGMERSPYSWAPSYGQSYNGTYGARADGSWNGYGYYR